MTNMRRTLFCLLLSLAAVCAAQPLPILQVASQQPNIRLHRADELRQSHRWLADGERALRLDWTQTLGSHYEFFYEGSLLPVLTFTKAIVHARAFLPENHSLKYLNLRLRDQRGTIFQFRRDVEGLTGWHTLDFPVDASQPIASCWDGGAKGPTKPTLPLRLHGFAGDYRTAKADAKANWMLLGDVSCTVTLDLTPLTFALKTDHPLHLLLERDGAVADAAPQAVLVNRTQRSASGTFVVSVRDHLGQVVETHRAEATLAPGQTHAIALSIPERRGIRYVDFTFTESDPRVEQAKRTLSFARLAPAGPTPGRGKGFLFGVCSHPQSKPREHQELEAMAAGLMGAKIMREDVGWGRFQPREDTWNFEPFDYCVDIFGKYGVELEAIYSYCAPWAVAKDWKPIRPNWKRGQRPDYGHWARFIRTFAKRYRGKVHYVEVWNEPELFGFANFTAEEYVELMKIAYTETKREAPEMTVLTAGFTTYPALARYNDPLHMEKSLTLGRGFYDVHAFHGHGPYDGYRNTIRALLDIRRELKVEQVPWYANETAVPSNWGGELWQATQLIQKFLFSWANGSIGYNWYDLRNDGFDPQDGEHNFGLITHDFHPKAAYLSYTMLARHFTQATYRQPLPLDGGQDAFVFTAQNGDMLIPHWNSDSTIASRLILLGGLSDRTTATLVDIFGNETPLPVQNNAVIINITKQPAVLRLAGQKDLPTPRDFFSIVRGKPVMDNPGNSQNYRLRAQDLFLAANAPNQLSFTLTNPTAKPLDAAIRLQLIPGITADADRLACVIPPGQTAQLDFTLRSDTLPLQATIQAQVQLGSLWTGTFPIAISRVTTLPVPDGKPAFVVNQRSQNTKLVPEAGDLQHLTWTGPEDCSAQFWLDIRDGRLLVTAVVTDDRHVQPFSGFDVWKGDNIQLAICHGSEPYCELGLTHRNDGASETFVFSAPKDAKPSVSLQTARDDAKRTTTYRAAIDLASIGMTEDTARRGFLFNAIVNDNDGDTREGYMAIAPGIGTGKSVRLFPVIRLADK